MASQFMQPPQLTPLGNSVVSIGPAGSAYTSMEQSGRSLLKTYCDDFPNTRKSFIIPPMFDSVYTEVMPGHSRGLSRKEENKYDGVMISQSGEMAEKTVYDMINEILRKKISKQPILAFFGVQMDNDNNTNARGRALIAELTKMSFSGIKCTGEFDCIIAVKDLGTIHIEVKRTYNVKNITAADAQLDNGTKFVTNLMDAIRGAPSNFPTARVIVLPYEKSESPVCKSTSDSFVAHDDVCQNFTPLWNKVIEDLEKKNKSNPYPFTCAEFASFTSILMGWYSSEPYNHGPYTECTYNDLSLSLPKHVSNIDEKVKRAEITSEESKSKSEHEKQKPVSDIFRTNPRDIFRNVDGIGLLYLTPDQHNLYYNFPQAIVHGHSGTGKTILCLMKMMDLIRSGANVKILFVAPHPSHLFCYDILSRNNFNVRTFKDFPILQEANCDIVIVTLNEFLNDPRINDTSLLSGYNILIDDLQDYFNEQCDTFNLSKVSDLIQNIFIAARNHDLIAWFCFDIVQCSNLDATWHNLIWCFPQFKTTKDIPPTVFLKHVLRNTSEIISSVAEGRKKVLEGIKNKYKIVKDLYNGHLITSERVQCHRLNSSVSPKWRVAFVFEKIQDELKDLTRGRYALPMSNIAILVDDDSVLADYKKSIDQMLSTYFNTISQSIEDSITYQRDDRVLLDVTENVASFESPIVIYIRTDMIGRIYRMLSRARTKLIIVDVNESPMEFDSIDVIDWTECNSKFLNVSNFTDAFKDKSFEQMESLVSEEPCYLKVRNPEGLTPFLRAAELGCVRGIKTCINLGSDRNEKDNFGKTAAMIAVRSSHLATLEYLMKSGVSPDVKDNDGNNILHHALNIESIECLNWILQNFSDLLKSTAIIFELAKNGNIEKLKVLHDLGISLEEEDSQGNTILHYAYKAEQKDCIEWIVQNYERLAVFVHSGNILTAYEIAAAGDVKMLDMLRDKGFSLKNADSEGNTILQHAYNAGTIDSCKWIVQHYPELVYVRNNQNTSFLYKTAKDGDIEMLEMLRDQGVSIEETDEGKTILYHAVGVAKIEFFKWILQNYSDLLKDTPISYELAINGNVEKLKILRDQGFSLEEAESRGEIILYHCIHNKKTECFNWILENCPQLAQITNMKALLYEVTSTDGDKLSMLEKLCEHVQSSKMSNESQYLAHKAALNCNVEELKALITKKEKQVVSDTEDRYVHLQPIAGEEVAIFNDNGLLFKKGYEKQECKNMPSIVYASAAYVDKGCKVYYEVRIPFKSNWYSSPSIGWAIFDFTLSQDHRHMFAYDPDAGLKYHNDNLDKWGLQIDYDSKWHTIGVAADLVNGKLLYSVDGNWEGKMGVAFEGLDDDVVLFPAISVYFHHFLPLLVNFGEAAFEYSPPDPTFKSVEELMKGTNILHVLARNNKVEQCKYIIDTYPQLLNETSGRGTPLHECASTGALESMKVLLDAGADMNLKNIFGGTALDVARSNNYSSCVKELCNIDYHYSF